MRILTGPLVMIAAAIFWFGSGTFLDRGFAYTGGITAFIFFLIGLRMTLTDRERRD